MPRTPAVWLPAPPSPRISYFSHYAGSVKGTANIWANSLDCEARDGIGIGSIDADEAILQDTDDLIVTRVVAIRDA
jgi:hypothetical protein